MHRRTYFTQGKKGKSKVPALREILIKNSTKSVDIFESTISVTITTGCGYSQKHNVCKG